MTDIIWPIIITIGVSILIIFVSIGHHCWCRQKDPDTCPYCQHVLKQKDKCDLCGASRVNINMEVKSL